MIVDGEEQHIQLSTYINEAGKASDAIMKKVSLTLRVHSSLVSEVFMREFKKF